MRIEFETLIGTSRFIENIANIDVARPVLYSEIFDSESGTKGLIFPKF